MEREFNVEILTPSQTIFSGEATEVVLPAYDGEVGVLAGHADFIGLLGTGALKIVTDGNDYWYLLSSGAYQVKSGKLTILAELGEKPEKTIDLDTLTARMKDLEAELADPKTFSADDYPRVKLEYDRTKARIDIHRRTEILN